MQGGTAERGAAAVAAPIVGDDAYGGITVAALLLRAQRRAVQLENQLDEVMAQIDSLKILANRLAGARD